MLTNPSAMGITILRIVCEMHPDLTLLAICYLLCKKFLNLNSILCTCQFFILPSEVLIFSLFYILFFMPALTRYDYQAGFWGAMGCQCLGIIPVRAMKTLFIVHVQLNFIFFIC